MPNSGHGGFPGTRVMTIFVFYVSAQIPNIEYFEVYGGLLGRVLRDSVVCESLPWAAQDQCPLVFKSN